MSEWLVFGAGLVFALCAAICAAYDIARRKVDGLKVKEVDAIADQLRALHGAQDATQTRLDNHDLRICAHSEQFDDIRARSKQNSADVENLREDNKAEFAAMKVAFDRATARDAVAGATVRDTSRQFG